MEAWCKSEGPWKRSCASSLSINFRSQFDVFFASNDLQNSTFMGVWYISLAFKQRPVSCHLQALRQKDHLFQHSKLGCLSKGVFEPRSSTESEAFFPFNRPWLYQICLTKCLYSGLWRRFVLNFGQECPRMQEVLFRLKCVAQKSLMLKLGYFNVLKWVISSWLYIKCFIIQSKNFSVSD